MSAIRKPLTAFKRYHKIIDEMKDAHVPALSSEECGVKQRANKFLRRRSLTTDDTHLREGGVETTQEIGTKGKIIRFAALQHQTHLQDNDRPCDYVIKPINETIFLHIARSYNNRRRDRSLPSNSICRRVFFAQCCERVFCRHFTVSGRNLFRRFAVFKTCCVSCIVKV